MYTYRIRGKRGPFKIILPDSFCSFLTPPGMSGSPPSFSDYLYFYSFMNRKIHAHFHWQPISIVRYCSFSFFREDYAETVIVLFLIFRIGLFNNICPYCLPVCPPARRHFSDPLWGHFLFSGITNQVCRPFSRILRDRKRHILLEVRTGNIAGLFASPKDGIRLPQSVTYLPYPSPHHMAFLLSREGLCPRNSIFSLKK